MWPFKKAEQRASVENPSVPISNQAILDFFNLNDVNSAGENVTVDSALGVPAVWAAVNVISGTIARLPLHVYRRTGEGRERSEQPIAAILHDAVNDEMSSYQWRKYLFQQVLTVGRGVSFIERNGAGRVKNIWPLDPAGLTIKRTNGRKVYEYRDGSRVVSYAAADVIDIPFALHADGLKHYSPIMQNREAIGLAQSVTKHGGKYFANGGVPPFAVTGNFQSGQAMQRASDDLQSAVKKASAENRLALTMPVGLEIKSIGGDPEKMQMVELQRFCVEQIARIWSLSPIFLQDLTHGTFSNTEQQDLHFVKHTLGSWIECFEQEMNLKLFGRSNNTQYVELNVDGLLRGDFKTRMEGYAQGIQNGVLKPNEARRAENRPNEEGGDRLYMQGAMVPIEQAGQDQGGQDGE